MTKPIPTLNDCPKCGCSGITISEIVRDCTLGYMAECMDSDCFHSGPFRKTRLGAARAWNKHAADYWKQKPGVVILTKETLGIEIIKPFGTVQE